MSTSKIPLIFFSGMAADERVLEHQLDFFPDMFVPQWISPLPSEKISDYCARFSKQIDPGRPCIVGGVSFGGIVALEMQNHLDTLGCILIGSVKTVEQLPKRIRLFRSFPYALNFVPIFLLQKAAVLAGISAGMCGAKTIEKLSCQFSDSDIRLLRWSAAQVLNWSLRPTAHIVRHIHGSADPIFPVDRVVADEVIPGGGHVISMTHPEQVNRFIQKHVNEFSRLNAS